MGKRVRKYIRLWIAPRIVGSSSPLYRGLRGRKFSGAHSLYGQMTVENYWLVVQVPANGKKYWPAIAG